MKKFSVEKNHLGKTLKKIRKSKGYTLQKLGEILGASPGFISEVESGKKTPGGEFLFSLKRKLNVNLNDLFSEDIFDNENQLVTENTESYRSEGSKGSDTVHFLTQMLKEKSEFVKSLQKQIKELREDKKVLKTMLDKQDEQIQELKSNYNTGN